MEVIRQAVMAGSNSRQAFQAYLCGIAGRFFWHVRQYLQAGIAGSMMAFQEGIQGMICRKCSKKFQEF
jgi:hypothetical protein